MTAYLQERPSDTAEFSWLALAPYWGNLRPDHVNVDRCREYTELRRDAGRGDGTIIRELGVLKACIRRHANNAGAVFEMPTSPPPRDRYLTKAEYRRLLAATEQHHVELFIRLALATAARAGAVLGMTWAQVDFGRDLVNLGVGTRHKGRAVVPMTSSLKRSLQQAYEARTCVHVIEYRGGPVASIRKGFEATCRRAKLKGVSPHVLRHTAAVWMAEDGVPMSEIAQFLGHSSEKVTFKVYARYSPDYMRRAVNSLDVE